MKKNFICFLVFFIQTTLLYAQLENCEEVKKENEYLKKALNILQPKKTNTTKNIDFSIQKCEGNIKEQTITLTLIVTNKGPNTDLNINSAVIVDVEANEYRTYNIKIGSSGTFNKIFTDVPVKATFQFNKVMPGTNLLKLVSIDIYSSGNASFEYKDVSVTWK
jgi:hypothetical protein